MHVSWSPPGASRHRVSLNSGAWEDATGSSHVIAGLVPGTAYAVRVQAGNEHGWGGIASTTCTTVDIAAVPSTCAPASGAGGYCLDSGDTATINIPTPGQSDRSGRSAPNSVVLKRIRATRDITKTLFNNRTVYLVRKGELGGYIESAANLGAGVQSAASQGPGVQSAASVGAGAPWVFHDARVYGDARVFGNGRIYGDAVVWGRAWVYGNAQVVGHARVSGDARVYDRATVADNAQVSGSAEIYEYAFVHDNAQVAGDAKVYGYDTQVYGDAKVCGSYGRPFSIPVRRTCGAPHIRGSAEVYDSAEVFGSAVIGRQRGGVGHPKVYGRAKVYGHANVFGSVQVYGNAMVYQYAEIFEYAHVYGQAKVRGLDDSHRRAYKKGDDLDGRGARVFGYSRVHGNAEIYDDAYVYGDRATYDAAEVFGQAEVYENARIRGFAKIHGQAQIYGNAQVRSKAQVFDSAKVYGNAQVYGNARVFDYAASKEAENKRHLITDDTPELQNLFTADDPAHKFWNNSYKFKESRLRFAPLSAYERKFSDATKYAVTDLKSWDISVLGQKPDRPRSTRIFGYAHVLGNSKVWGGSYINGYAQVKQQSRISGGSDIFTGIICGDFWLNSIRYQQPSTPCNSVNTWLSFSKFGCFTANILAIALGWNPAGVAAGVVVNVVCFIIS